MQEVDILKKFHVKLTACITALLFVFSVSASALNHEMLIPVGRAVGIQMSSQGLLVEDVSPVDTESGQQNPAQKAGIKTGDVIISVNGQKVQDGANFQKLVSLSGENDIKIDIMRGDEQKQITVKPVKDSNGVYKLGVRVRDTINGIGTITYVDADTGEYGSLGHGICSGENGQLIPLKQGSLMQASVSRVVKGIAGTPGCLQGDFNTEYNIGTVEKNTLTGIYGTFTDDLYYKNLQPMEVASSDEIKTGEAIILSNIAGDEVKEYTCQIEKVYGAGGEYDRSMTIRITDNTLIEKTGGIVQGMSGSPILQNGKIIGAVTHVLVSDPTRGYAIQIDKMLEKA